VETSPEEHQKGEPEKATPVLPTPVRRSLGVATPNPDPPERVIEFEKRRWVVRIAGRSKGGRTLSDVNLVEVEFVPEGGEGVTLRRLIVARDLEGLSDLQLGELLARASPAED